MERCVVSKEEPQLCVRSEMHGGDNSLFTHHSGNKGSECIPDRADIEEWGTDCRRLLLIVMIKRGRAEENDTECLWNGSGFFEQDKRGDIP